jgi:hypothetical protein
VVNTALVGGIVVLNGANRRLISLFFDGWGVRAVSLLCSGLGTVRISHSLKEHVTRAQLQAILTTSCTRTQYSCRDCGRFHFGTHKTTGVAVLQRDVEAMSPSLATISRVQQRGKAPNTLFAYLVILLSRDSAAHSADGAVANPLVNLDY